MSFQTSIATANDIHTLTLSGRLDSATSSEFEKTVQGIFATPGCRVVMDFASLEYISSAGLRVILMAAKRAKQGDGRLLLCGLLPHVREVFELSGFLKIIEVVADRDAAIARLGT